MIGTNLRRVRLARGFTLDELAKLSRVSRAMISQIELFQSAPTINVLWKLSAGLDLPFSALATPDGGSGILQVVRERDAALVEDDGTIRSRALFPLGSHQPELYRLSLAPGRVHRSAARPAGTLENLVVHAGAVEIEVEGEVTLLRDGDAITFPAERPHTYRNAGEAEAVMYLVVSYPGAQPPA